MSQTRKSRKIKRIKRLFLFIAFLLLLPLIFGWIGRYYVTNFTEELASEVNGRYEIDTQFGWFNSIITSKVEFDSRNFDQSQIALLESSPQSEDGSASDEEQENHIPIVLNITHELNHGPILFSTQPFKLIAPFFSPILINSAALIEGSAGVKISNLIGDYVTAKTKFKSISTITTRIKPGKRQFMFEGAIPMGILSPELVLERSLFDNDTDAFFSIAKAQIHSDDFSSPVFDEINLRLQPLIRKITPDLRSSAVITAKKMSTERISMNNVRTNSQIQPISNSTIAMQHSFNIAELMSDSVVVADSIGGSFSINGLTKSALRPIIDDFDQASMENLSNTMVNQPFTSEGYLSANTSAGPIHLNFALQHKPGSAQSRETLMRLFQQISGTAEFDMSDDAFLLLQLGLKKILLDSESNSGITRANGSSQISITINNGVAQIGNLYFDLPSLTLL